jgi:hypothetical protein
MIQTSSGNNNSKIEDRFYEHYKIVQDYISSLGTVRVSKNEDVSHALSLSSDILRSLSAEDCGMYAYSLSLYNIYLQKELSKHKIKLNWAKHNLSIIYGKYCSEFGTQYTKYDEKKDYVNHHNEAAQILLKMIVHAEGIIEEIDGYIRRVSFTLNTLLELQKTKRYVS